ncbi:hypothetical protein Ddc_07103 [Ditylenchus destructor]|nr:hypothetical protein Ddc_07103 [Ditylenchus destructor]
MSQIAPFLPKQDEIIIRLSVSGTFICMVLWFWNAGFLMLFYVANCGKQFHPILMYFFYICSSAPEDNSRMIWTLMNIWFLAMLLVSLAIYGIGLRTIQRKFRTFHLSLPTTSTGTATEPNTMLPHERKEYLQLQNRQFILLQGCLVSLFSVIRLIVFFAVPWLTQSVLDLDTNAIALANIFGNCITILCFAANPIVFWIFNERVRRIVCQMALLAKAGEGHGVRALFHRSDSNTRNGTPKTC